MSSSGTTISMVSNTNSTLHKVHHHYPHKPSTTNLTKSSSHSTSSLTSSQEGSASSAAIYIDDTEDTIHSLPGDLQHADTKSSTLTESLSLPDIKRDNEQHSKQPHLHRKHHSHHVHPFPPSHHNHKPYKSSKTHPKPVKSQPHHANSSHPHQSSLFGHDYIRNFVILSKLYSPQEYYSNIQITQLPFMSVKKHKYRGSDCPSDISSLDSRRRKRSKSKPSKWRKLITWMKYMNSTLCQTFKFLFEVMLLWCNKFQKWQKELHEAPIEVKEKYFFVVSTIISTILFYILFICLDVMIKHWFALPSFITEYSFSISYCISYLTSVIWQHFFNQYFVFTITRYTNHANSMDSAFCDSLFRTYLVYGCSLMMTGIMGSLLQIYAGIADELILFLTLPISGIMNYYLLRYCHNKQQQEYQLLPTNNNEIYHHHTRDEKSTRHMKKNKYVKKTTYHKKNNIKHHQNKHKHVHAVDDIVIV
eukprot:458338_1